jgi:hypothetical protein
MQNKCVTVGGQIPMETERALTVEECDHLADALSDEAAALPVGSKKDGLLRLAESYRSLARMKRLVLREVN